MNHGIYEAFVLYEEANGQKGNYELIVLANSAAAAIRMASQIAGRLFSTIKVLDVCAALVEDDWMPVRKFGQTPSGFRRAKDYCKASNAAVTP
jgi:hypothetical protein